jgi:hypothetical protein
LLRSKHASLRCTTTRHACPGWEGMIGRPKGKPAPQWPARSEDDGSSFGSDSLSWADVLERVKGIETSLSAWESG